MRRSLVAISLAVSLIFGLAGCDKIPTWGELTGGQKPAPVVAPTSQSQIPATVQTVIAAPLTASEVIAKFNTLRPNEITDASISQLTSLTEGLDQITEINADASGVTKNSFTSIEKLTNLRQLRLGSTRIDNEACMKIGQLSSLETLVLSSTPVTNAGIAALAGLQNLKHLELARCDLSEGGAQAIGQLPSLEFISLESTNLSNKSLEFICNAKTLKQFVISYNFAIDDYGLAAVKKLPAMEYLDINHTRFTGEGLIFAQKGGGLKSLTTLIMSACPLNEKGVQAVSNCKSLEVLNIGDIALLNDQAVFHIISGMKNLRYLNVSLCPLLNGEGLAPLKGSKVLEELYINQNSNMGDAMVPGLITLKNLKMLAIHGTSISPVGISKLRASLPEARLN